MYPQALQLRLERAVSDYEFQHQVKPSLLQINRSDYNAMLPRQSIDARCGLCIKGVVVIGLGDIALGRYHLLP